MSGCLIDANQLIYSLNPASPERSVVAEAFRLLILGQRPAYLVPQVLTEFWVIATKPINAERPEYSGLGLTPAEAKTEIDVFLSTFDFLPDTPAVFDEWLRLVSRHETKGKKAHDARLVAFMRVYEIDRILTHNRDDFKRYPGIQAVTPHELLALLKQEDAAQSDG